MSHCGCVGCVFSRGMDFSVDLTSRASTTHVCLRGPHSCGGELRHVFRRCGPVVSAHRFPHDRRKSHAPMTLHVCIEDTPLLTPHPSSTEDGIGKNPRVQSPTLGRMEEWDVRNRMRRDSMEECSTEVGRCSHPQRRRYQSMGNKESNRREGGETHRIERKWWNQE